MSRIFSEFQLKDITLKNRLVRSATTSYWSDQDGILTNPILKYYGKLAKGGIGLIIKGHSYVSEKAKAHTGQSGLSSDKHIPRMKELTELTHSFNTPIIAQLNHGGYNCKADRVTASDYKMPNGEARGATKKDIKKIIENFANSAEHALQSGFDGIQIHGAHGYLISQFLSDIVNKREDEYGGSLEKRSKLLFEIYKETRKRLGNKALIGIKLNCDDFAEKRGVRLEDSIKVAKWLKNKGIDFIEISGGGPEQQAKIRRERAKPEPETGFFEANFGGHAQRIRESVPEIPLALVDGIRSKSTIDSLLKHDVVDLVSMSRPLIIEPDLPERLKKSQLKSSCISCSKCVSKEAFGKMMLRCIHLNP